MSLSLKLKRLYPERDRELPLPYYAEEGSVGLDLLATEERLLNPGERAAIPTGVAIAIPEGYEGQIRPRSGIARDAGVTVLNSPGTIDPTYRGELLVLLINHGASAFQIRREMRIAQLVIAPVVKVELVEVDALPETGRGSGGFGSTGR
jgi:dUTP pyrophosphatase